MKKHNYIRYTSQKWYIKEERMTIFISSKAQKMDGKKRESKLSTHNVPIKGREGADAFGFGTCLY